MTEVAALLAGLDHPRADDIRSLCSAITMAFPDFTDEVKWNAPSYQLAGVNIVTLRVQPPPNFQVILHVGAKKVVDPPALRFDIAGVRHTWAEPSRGILHIDDAADIPAAIAAIGKWRNRVKAQGLA